jgi:hypothetical protein
MVEIPQKFSTKPDAWQHQQYRINFTAAKSTKGKQMLWFFLTRITATNSGLAGVRTL